MLNLIRRSIAVTGLTMVATLGFASTAWAHAAISPPTAETGVLQQFTLAVPTEEDNATTTEIQLTVPDGVAIDSFEPEPGWTRSVKATGTGEDAIVNQVTWTGGAVPTDEDSVFRFQATLTGGSKTYTFGVRQTYSDGTVVEWTGDETSDTPSPTIKGVSSLGSTSNTLPIIAIVLGAIGVLLGAIALFSGRRSLT
jgi:uncharacterized protein YcnI